MTAALSMPLAVDLAAWPAVVLRTDARGTVVASNGRLEQRLRAAVVGRALTELLDADSSLAKWGRVAAGAATARPLELIFASADRLLDTGTYTVLPLGAADGWWLVEHPMPARLTELAGAVATVNAELATTQRRLVVEQGRLAHAMSELERSNGALDEFAHAVSHDLKAPLRGIREYAAILLADASPLTEEERAGDLRRIRELADRMRRMIDAALQYARAGRASERVELVDTGALLHDVVAFLAPPADVAIHVAPDMPTLEAERVPVEQVFRNLLSNAITYRRPAGARIDVSAADAGRCWDMIVADNGPGIAAADQPRVWRLFHTSRPGEGTGLGLALVKRIVEAHGGAIELRSSAGTGAAFHVLWPKAPVPTARDRSR